MSSQALAEWKRGWPVVLTGAIGYGTGLALFNLSAGLFIQPRRDDLGWSVRAVSLAPFAGIVMALCNPMAGMLVDRFGARQGLLAGQLLFALGLVILAMTPPTPMAIYAAVILLGAVSPLTNIAPIAKGVASWFRTGTGTAIGVTLNGISIVALVAVPILGYVIAQYSWRGGYLCLAGLILCVGLPLTLAGFRERNAVPGEVNDRPDVEDSGALSALRDSRFWGLMVVLIMSAIPLGGFLTHLVPILRASGFAAGEAIWLATLFPLSMMFGRVGGGFMLDRLPPHMVAAGLLITAGGGALLLHHLGASPLSTIAVPAILLLGAAQGAESDYVAFFTLRYFGMKAYSTIVGIYALAVGLSMSVGGLGFAEVYDRQGSYTLAIMAGAGGFFVAAIAMAITAQLARRERALSKRSTPGTYSQIS